MAKFEKTIGRLETIRNAQSDLMARMEGEGVQQDILKAQSKVVKALDVAIRVLIRRRNVLLSK